MRAKHLKLIAVLVLAGAMLCASAYAKKSRARAKRTAREKPTAGEIERRITESEVPAAALAALKKLAAGAKITEFAEEIEHGQTFYEGSWKSAAGVGTDVLVTKTGDLVEVEEKIPLDKVPAAVVKAARRAAGKSAQLSCEKKTMILYEIKFTKAGSRHELLLSPDGRRVEEEIEKREPRKVSRARGKDEDDEDDQGK